MQRTKWKLHVTTLAICPLLLSACGGVGVPSVPATYGDAASSTNATQLQSAPTADVRTTQAAATVSSARVSWADAFVNSVGVDTHFNYGQSAYRSKYQAIREALIESGIRHVRDGSFAYSDPQALASLGESGITHSVEFPVNVTAEQITSTLQAFGSNVDFVEPQNEYDESDGSDPHWPSEIVSEQKLLFSTVKSNPAFASIAVLGPSFGHPRDAAMVGPLDAYEDAGNEHDYTCNSNPGTMNSTGIGSITTLLRAATNAKPIWTTEVGYADNASGWACALPDSTIAKYDPRVIAERWLSGEPRTYFYQFADTFPDLNYDSMGLVTEDGSPKAQYDAIQSLLSLLRDPGSSFTPKPLDYTIGGNTTNLKQVLLQKRDGSYYLLLWLEVPSWNTSTNSVLRIPPQNVTLSLAGTPSSAAQYRYGANWRLQACTLRPARTESLSVSDAISVVRLQF
jgi:hypothetical protein